MTLTAKHTPGPFTAHRHERIKGPCADPHLEVTWSISAKGEPVGSTFEFPTLCIVRKEEDANLFAAAPDLAECLKTALVLVRLKYGNLDKDVWDFQLKCEAALTKAGYTKG